MSDSILGTLAKNGANPRFALVMGNSIFELNDEVTAFTEITPYYARGSLLLTEASTLEEGVLALKGGGVVILPLDHQDKIASHIRVE